jgi:hypothetical protein
MRREAMKTLIEMMLTAALLAAELLAMAPILAPGEVWRAFRSAGSRVRTRAVAIERAARRRVRRRFERGDRWRGTWPHPPRFA